MLVVTLLAGGTRACACSAIDSRGDDSQASLWSSSWSFVFSNAWNNNEGAGSFRRSAAGHLRVGLKRSLCFERGKYLCCFFTLHQLGSCSFPPSSASAGGRMLLPPISSHRRLHLHPPFPLYFPWRKGLRSWNEKACNWVRLPHLNHFYLCF